MPTFSIYDANRDLMRTRRADWHRDYTYASLWNYYQPASGGHGSYWHRWSVGNEVDWKQNYRLWMQFINEFKNLTGFGVIVNTSFNVRGEPIVCSPEHAYRCFMRTEMDYLVLGAFLLDKKAQPRFEEKGDWRQDYQLD